ncbi:interleukin-3 receptor subunit alpha isoform X4 [Lagenorhynchus albirostris]|uniref:interleukin-3 receptor subunit alpha isoform X4 n=1 Tax=Lagenorhynchus albirostris TaxID=27610 RepID=UPI0028EA04D7|nr:interleukin-3 receptor subunit alpha isoform X4 [Lagenorhynchus albirostris]
METFPKLCVSSIQKLSLRRESQGGCRKPDLLGSRRGFPDVQLGGGPGGPEGRAVPSVPGEPGDQTRFLVNGTGSGSKIPCSETSDRLAKIEVLAAPNITSRWCNQSYSFMQWQVRSHLNDDFKYELQIQKGTELAYKQEIYKAFLELNNPGTYTVQVRARDATFSHYKPWGPWSVPQHFVCEEGARLPVWLTSLLIALGTLLAMGLVLRFCRFSVMQKLFPPIPHMKDHINGKLQNGRTVRGLPPGTHLVPDDLGPRPRQPGGVSSGRGAGSGGNMKLVQRPGFPPGRGRTACSWQVVDVSSGVRDGKARCS